jgi:predicted nucleic acid-binding protein
MLGVKLITADKKLLNTFPDAAATAKNYIAGFA